MKIRDQLPNESDYNYAKFVEAVKTLGDRYILAKPVPKPAQVEWKL